DERNKLPLVRKQLPRRRAAFVRDARRPGRDVEPRVGERGPVPVDEDRAAVAEAQVVAAHVEMEERVALGRRTVDGRENRRERALEPARIAKARREKRRGILRHDLPPLPQTGMRVAHRRRSRRRRARCDRCHRVENRRDTFGRPTSRTVKRSAVEYPPGRGTYETGREPSSRSSRSSTARIATSRATALRPLSPRAPAPRARPAAPCPACRTATCRRS